MESNYEHLDAILNITYTPVSDHAVHILSASKDGMLILWTLSGAVVLVLKIDTVFSFLKTPNSLNT